MNTQIAQIAAAYMFVAGFSYLCTRLFRPAFPHVSASRRRVLGRVAVGLCAAAAVVWAVALFLDGGVIRAIVAGFIFVVGVQTLLGVLGIKSDMLANQPMGNEVVPDAFRLGVLPDRTRDPHGPWILTLLSYLDGLLSSTGLPAPGMSVPQQEGGPTDKSGKTDPIEIAQILNRYASPEVIGKFRDVMISSERLKYMSLLPDANVIEARQEFVKLVSELRVDLMLSNAAADLRVGPVFRP